MIFILLSLVRFMNTFEYFKTLKILTIPPPLFFFFTILSDPAEKTHAATTEHYYFVVRLMYMCQFPMAISILQSFKISTFKRFWYFTFLASILLIFNKGPSQINMAYC